MSRPHRAPLTLAMIGALALALPLAGCGRKGGLDPPPGGYQVDKGVVRTPVSGRGASPASESARPDYDESGRPIPPAGRKKKLPGDWLID